MGNECWNSVSVYGPIAEIDRFRMFCVHLPPGIKAQAVLGGWDGCEVTIGFLGYISAEPSGVSRWGTMLDARNYREKAPKTGSWFFAFDTSDDFPARLFEELAATFPSLHFDCDCIHSMDEFMGYGWFNVPLGGEAFRQDMAVPRRYWTSGGGYKRAPKAQARHMAVVKALGQAASQYERGASRTNAEGNQHADF